ncbi:ral guanine nucleotide dissociation stimulator isoform X2 [Babesia caballi]|uniref:Ral guanine nucleotide dissociation stimulator isoform X2 n=1 Tax=Babesia caballi TaxID=5871 RepID=A0AAV4LS21_BABCB|nr:ral guanine nucleotide dissociation stimulator isoform X2 [Babesia caballi]
MKTTRGFEPSAASAKLPANAAVMRRAPRRLVSNTSFHRSISACRLAADANVSYKVGEGLVCNAAHDIFPELLNGSERSDVEEVTSAAVAEEPAGAVDSGMDICTVRLVIKGFEGKEAAFLGAAGCDDEVAVSRQEPAQRQP